MLTIRFNRTGKRNKAQFRIVVQERTVAPGGRHVEVLGSYDPHLKKGVFKNDKIKYWIEKGAQVSDSVYNLLVKKGVLKGRKRIIKVKKTKIAEAGETKPGEVQEKQKNESGGNEKEVEKTKESKIEEKK